MDHSRYDSEDEIFDRIAAPLAVLTGLSALAAAVAVVVRLRRRRTSRLRVVR